MTKFELEMMKSYIDLAITDIKDVIITSGEQTSRSIDDLNQTLIAHNGRLKKAEEATKIILLAKKRWYLILIVVIVLILILIPIVDLLGLTGILKLALINQ